MKRLDPIAKLLLLTWFSAAILLSGLWMSDEILSEALFCRFCDYPVPLLGNLTEYQGESLAWIMILVGVFLGFLVVHDVLRLSVEVVQDGTHM